MGHFDAWYTRLPVWAQHEVVSLYGVYRYWLRFGPGFKRDVQSFIDRNHYTLEQWQDWQSIRLKEILNLAVEHIPYYRSNWSEEVQQAARTGDLKTIPVLEKLPIRDNPDQFMRDDLSIKPQIIFHTSGSSGTPIKNIYSVNEVRRSLAVREARSANWAGVSFKMPRATFSGRLVETNPNSTGPFYRYNRIENQVYFSAFHLRPETAKKYVHALTKHNIRWITGYAVSTYLLAKFILMQNIKSPKLDAVVTTSEKVTGEMRSVIEKAFNCEVFEEYSTVENALFASECERGQLHISPDMGIVEILRSDGSYCLPGEVGEVVTTSLMREVQCFIRYRLGDLAAWSEYPCPCGRQMPVLKEVTGRLEDVVVAPDGRQMVRFHGIFVDQPHIIEGQIIQRELDEVCVKVVTTSDFNPEDEADVVHRVQQRLGSQVNVTVEMVSEIPRTKSGKFKAVVSLLNQPS